VSAARRGTRLNVTCTPVAGARGYEVRVALPRDGRRLVFFPSRRKRRLVVGGVERSDSATVTVAAVGPDARAGRPAKAVVRPAKLRRRR
jgi:hypothetical protein